MSNGGELIVKDSVLAQDQKSSNGQVIGFGLEGLTHKNNSVQFMGNVIYLERTGVNKPLARPSASPNNFYVLQDQNIVIGDGGIENSVEDKSYFKNRIKFAPISIFPSKLLSR